MSSDDFGPTQRKVILAMRQAHHNELTISQLFAYVCPASVPGTPRHNQQRLGPFLCRINRKFERLKVPNRIRPGKTKNTYRLWSSDTAYINWRKTTI